MTSIQPARQTARIQDVAARAGVSIKTVSRVLNRESNVRESTRRKVLESAEALGYHPNRSARGLAGRRSFLLGLIYNNPSANYISDVITGVLAACRSEGYGLVMHTAAHDTPDLVSNVMDFMGQSRADGLILMPPVSDVAHLVDALDKADFPYARLAPQDSRSGLGVVIDDRRAAFDMTEYLLGLGHRRIAFIKGHPDHGASALRFRGFTDAMTQYGVHVDPELVYQGYFDFDSGLEVARDLFRLPDLPTAIFSANDDMAAAVIQEAARRNIAIPDRISVAGFDDTPIAREIWPRLTTIRQPGEAMAQRLATMLLETLRDAGSDGGEETAGQVVTLKYKMMIRNSTAAPRS